MKTILVVDDEPRIRQLFRHAFEDEGYTVMEAEGGDAALQTLRTHAADLVMLDICMPGTHGLELLSRLHAAHPRLPIILCSAVGALFDEFAVWDAQDQVVGLFRKPVAISDLMSCADRALGAPSPSRST